MQLQLAFDAKRAFHNGTGLGNYSRFILSQMALLEPEGRYLLLNPKRGVYFNQRSTVLKEVLPSGIWTHFSAMWRSGGMLNDLKRHKVKVFHGLSNELPWGLTKAKLASVVSIHDLIFETHPQFYKPADRLIYRRKFKSASENADVVVAVSQFTKQELINRYGIPAHKIEVHYQSCHPAFHSQDAVVLSAEFQAKIPKEFVLYVGTIEERKRLMDVIIAIKQLDIPLVVVGKGGKYANLCKTYVQNEKIQNRVIFIETIGISDLVALYRMAKTFIYPSEVEGFGIPIIEALFSHCPVITTKGGVFHETGGPNSIYVKMGDVEHMAASLNALLVNQDYASEVATKGYIYAKQHFLPDRCMHGLIELYRRFH